MNKEQQVKEMPKSCTECRWCACDITYYNVCALKYESLDNLDLSKKPNWCPLVEKEGI